MQRGRTKSRAALPRHSEAVCAGMRRLCSAHRWVIHKLNSIIRPFSPTFPNMPRTQVQKSSATLPLRSAACLLCVFVITGCTSIGKQYVSPLPNEPGAAFIAEVRGVLIHTFDEEGCYAGKTELPVGKDFRLHAGKEAFMAYETHWAPVRGGIPNLGWVCTALFSFVPHQDSRYQFKGASLPAALLGDGSFAPPVCSAVVVRQSETVIPELVNTKRLKFSPRGFACLRIIERQ